MENFSKKDLQDFDVVEYRNGSRRVNIGGKLSAIDYPFRLDIASFTSNLCHDQEQYDIMKVWRFENVINVIETLQGKVWGKSLWEREEYKMPEIEKMKDLVSELSNLLNIK